MIRDSVQYLFSVSVYYRDSLYNHVPYGDILSVISDRWRCIARNFSWCGVSSRPSLPPQQGNSFANMARQASSCLCS